MREGHRENRLEGFHRQSWVENLNQRENQMQVKVKVKMKEDQLVLMGLNEHGCEMKYWCCCDGDGGGGWDFEREY